MKKTIINKPTRRINESRFLDNLTADLAATKFKKLRPFDLKDLGYVFEAPLKVVLCDEGEYDLRAVLDADTRRQASFCFLIEPKTNMGIVLPHPFNHYVEVAHE